MENSGNFCVGQVPRTSHVATRPKKHVSDASVPRCHGLFSAGPASSLFVVGCRRCPSCDTYQVPVCSWTTLYSFFLFSAAAGSSNKILEDCLQLLAAAVFFHYFVIFRFSFSAKVYALGPHGWLYCCILSQYRGSLNVSIEFG